MSLANISGGGTTESALSVRVLAVAATALSEQKAAEKAHSLFRKALDTAQSGLSNEDPANRALAIAGNNLACALEEKPSRIAVETELMVLAAQAGRKYWEIAGTWLEIERAEYRLSQTYLKAGDPARSFEHARICLTIVQENDAPALEYFFAYETLAQAENARGNALGFATAVENAKARFDQLSDDDKSWCATALGRLVGT